VRLDDSGIAATRPPSHASAAAVIRHSPTIVCRLVGELLYRYAA
jgi:hypothetical protein